MDKFKDISVEPDTFIQSSRYVKIDGLDCKHELWVWDGIEAESLIFCTNELKSIEESILKGLINKFLNRPLSDDIKITSKSNENYTYVNFNFNIKA